MSKCSKKCNKIKQKIDSISGLDDDYVYESLLELEVHLDEIVQRIVTYLETNNINGTCFNKGDKTSKADEMFEELGYIKDIGEIYGVIRYKHITEDYYIRFYLEDKTFDCNRISNNAIFPLEIDMKLLKAIYTKMEELEC